MCDEVGKTEALAEVRTSINRKLPKWPLFPSVKRVVVVPRPHTLAPAIVYCRGRAAGAGTLPSAYRRTKLGAYAGAFPARPWRLKSRPALTVRRKREHSGLTSVR